MEEYTHLTNTGVLLRTADTYEDVTGIGWSVGFNPESLFRWDYDTQRWGRTAYSWEYANAEFGPLVLNNDDE